MRLSFCLFVCLGDGLVSDHLFIPLIYGDFLKKEIFVKTRNLVNCKSNYELLEEKFNWISRNINYFGAQTQGMRFPSSELSL